MYGWQRRSSASAGKRAFQPSSWNPGAVARDTRVGLAVSKPDDPSEREAATVAERVLAGGDARIQTAPTASIQRDDAGGDGGAGAAGALPLGDGRPLDRGVRSALEPRFGADFSHVRVHAGADARRAADALGARAFTIGDHIGFHGGEHRPDGTSGLRLLAHELTHVVQQQRSGGVAIQRDAFGSPPVSVRSPVFEEAATQITDLTASVEGRALGAAEIALVQPVFGTSIDLTRVRLLTSDLLPFRTVGNTVRVPHNFSIDNAEHAQTLVHEMTHVWQYQHGGTSYLSISLATQIAAMIGSGSRNGAYDYTVDPQRSFFSFTPEQQAMIVENYFSMRRDQAGPPQDSYRGNHVGTSGFFDYMSATDRMAEIARELPTHETWIAQMRVSMPASEHSILMQRASEVMTVPGNALAPVPSDRALTPVKPLLEIRF